MKKQNLIALVGVVALVANLLLPGLAFGQADDTSTQQGTAQIACSTGGVVAFSPDTTMDDFSFYADSEALTKIQQGTTDVTYGFSNKTSADAEPTHLNRFISVYDPRDPRDPLCANGGIQVDVSALDSNDDGNYFDGEDGVDAIPAEYAAGLVSPQNLYVATQNDFTVLNYTKDDTGYVYLGDGTADPDHATYCNTVGYDCTGVTTAGKDLPSPYNDFTTFQSNGQAITAGDVGAEYSNNVVIMSNDGIGFLGYSGVNAIFGLRVPPLQATKTYLVDIVFTLTTP